MTQESRAIIGLTTWRNGANACWRNQCSSELVVTYELRGQARLPDQDAERTVYHDRRAGDESDHVVVTPAHRLLGRIRDHAVHETNVREFRMHGRRRLLVRQCQRHFQPGLRLGGIVAKLAQIEPILQRAHAEEDVTSMVTEITLSGGAFDDREHPGYA